MLDLKAEHEGDFHCRVPLAWVIEQSVHCGFCRNETPIKLMVGFVICSGYSETSYFGYDCQAKKYFLHKEYLFSQHLSITFYESAKYKEKGKQNLQSLPQIFVGDEEVCFSSELDDSCKESVCI